MDQLKEFLRQVVKYRFWISVVVATLFAGGAYVLGSGPIQTKTAAETTKITSASKDVQQYSGPTVPTPAYKPVVEEKTAVLTKDVDVAWKKLYDRQAPLLTWPESVSDRFRKWGRKWPTEEAADSAVQIAIIDYVEAYPKYSEEVFKIFQPFDYETGKGVVASPPRDALLRPTAFDLNKKPPKLGEVWASQERLWAQRTVLEVINSVNRNATDWDGAPLKEILALEVGNSTAQDQRSIADGETLEAPEAITAPNEPEEEDPAAAGGMGGMMGGMGGMMGSMMAGMKGRGGLGGGQEPEDVRYLAPKGGATQYKILPIMVTVLIDQDHIQDLLVELANSPMAIEVKEPEVRRPQSRVTKPEKGTQPMGYGGMMGGMGGMMGSMMSRGRGSSMAYGGMMSGMMGSMMSRGGAMRGDGGDMMGSMMAGMMGGGSAAAQKKGTDQRSTDRAKERAEAEKAIDTLKATTLFDPYFNIVELTVYGQARFYNQPPPEIEEPASPGEADPAAAAGADPAKAETPKAEAAKPEAPEAETPKAESPEAQPNPKSTTAEPAKADAAAPDADAAKADAPKTEAPKADAPKTDAPKADAAAPSEAKPAEPKS